MGEAHTAGSGRGWALKRALQRFRTLHRTNQQCERAPAGIRRFLACEGEPRSEKRSGAIPHHPSSSVRLAVGSILALHARVAAGEGREDSMMRFALQATAGGEGRKVPERCIERPWSPGNDPPAYAPVR
jgi:hypothetical protein